MQIGSPHWKEIIVDGAARFGILVTNQQADLMAAHGRELIEWNKRINLTAIIDPMEVAVKHFLDSLAGLPEIPPQARLLDLGSGGGFPGLPLKIMRPAQSMTLLDSVRKKVHFLKFVIRALQLQSVEVVYGRAESLEVGPDTPGGFDVITCRAVADLESLVSLAAPLLVPNGRLILYKGPKDQISKSNSSETLNVDNQGMAQDQDLKLPAIKGFNVHRQNYYLPFLGDARCLIVMKRVALA
jgi:16S rRNA (guanine527-N7)-methyltransferase